MSATFSNSAPSNFNLNTFLGSFFEKGRVYHSGEVLTELTVQEVYSAFSKAFNGLIHPKNASTYGSELGGLRISKVIDNNTHRLVEYDVVTCTSTANALKHLLGAKPWVSPRKDGVYNIEINHWYLDKTNSQSGEMRCIEHYRDTEDFDKLMVEMYPRIDIDEMMRQYSISDESLMILSGQPGTGKTCFAKLMMSAHALVQECDIDVVYVKDKELLKKDQFWAIMSRKEPDMIILDDLDAELLPRTTENPNEIVSNMLSYSDGIFDVDTKILITTNLTDSKIDKALVRAGRSFDTLCLPQLSRKEAIDIWVNTLQSTEEAFISRFTDMEVVSQAALVSEHQRYLKSKSPTYLRDKSISIRKLVEEGEVIRND